MSSTVLGLALVGLIAGSAIAVRWPPYTRTSFETHWMGFVAGVLILLALSVRNPWVAALALWIAVQPLCQAILSRRLGAPAGAKPFQRIDGTLAAVVGLGLYGLLEGRVDAAVLTWLAVGLVGFAVVNLTATVVLHYGVRWMRPDRSDGTMLTGGLLGTAPFHAWLLTLATLSTAYLSVLWTPWVWVAVPMFVVGLQHTRSYSAPAAGFIGLLTFVLLTRPVWAWAVPVASGAALTWTAAYGFGTFRASMSARANLATNCWSFVRHFRGLGAGLGCVQNVTYERHNHDMRWGWSTAHNDWMQTIMELGPIPVLLASGYLVTTWLALPATAAAAYAFALVAATAAFAVVYFPIRVPWQAAILLIAMAAL